MITPFDRKPRMDVPMNQERDESETEEIKECGIN